MRFDVRAQDVGVRIGRVLAGHLVRHRKGKGVVLVVQDVGTVGSTVPVVTPSGQIVPWERDAMVDDLGPAVVSVEVPGEPKGDGDADPA